MIRLSGISLSQGAFTLSLSLEVAGGDRLAIIGPSGAGKSTLLNVISGFQVPDGGRVEIAGREVTEAPVAERPISILFQDGNLFPHLSVFDNVALGRRTDLRLSESERAEVADCLALVGLDQFGGRLPGTLSGGQQSRVALARMLLRNRPVALLDEPFAALDPGLRRDMAALVAELCAARDITLVMVTHDLRGLDDLISDICLLEDGGIVVQGPLGDLVSDPPDALRPWL